MKSCSQMLHKIFNALAYANAGNLDAFLNMLKKDESLAQQDGIKMLDVAHGHRP